jgi:hypothetical protein
MGVLSVYATSLSYANFIILLYCYMFRSYDHLQVKTPIFCNVIKVSPRLSRRSLPSAVFRRDSPPTRSRSTGSGGESFSMLTSVEGNAVQGRMPL